MDAYVIARDDRAAAQAPMGRQHILLVNRDPVLLDPVRVVLDDARYNVTTTNAIPRSFALIATVPPALSIVDLEMTRQHGCELLVRRHAEARTAAIPVVVTARDARLLAHAERFPDLYGGQIPARDPLRRGHPARCRPGAHRHGVRGGALVRRRRRNPA